MVSKGEMWVLTRTASFLFPSFSVDAKIYHAIFLQKDSLGGWMVASQVCFNVTARCSYESCVLVLI